MQSTMTEREFMDRLADGLKARGYSLAQATKDSVREAAEAAGLEFAPEPVKLPERLELDARGFIRPAGSIFPWNSDEERKAGHALARDRYNAYPGLRAAAERVVQEARRCATQQDYAAVAAELEAELAKGPRP